MNHSEKSTSEENLEVSANSRHHDFISTKKKQNGQDERNFAAEPFAHGTERYSPKSIERARYNQTSDESFIASVLEPQRLYTKDDQLKGRTRVENMIFDICQMGSQRSSEVISSNKNKKCSDTVFSPYDISFDDRISIQTMDSKQFTSSFEYSQKELINLEQKVKGSGGDVSNNKWMKDKNYFDIHIIEHQNEQDDERESAKPRNDQNHDHQRFIELQNHSNILIESFGTNLSANPQETSNFHKNDQHDVKFIIQSKQNQLSQIKQAYQQTTNENEILKNRVKQLQTYFRGIIEHKIHQINLIKEPSIQLRRDQFKKATKIFRKFSL